MPTSAPVIAQLCQMLQQQLQYVGSKQAVRPTWMFTAWSVKFVATQHVWLTAKTAGFGMHIPGRLISEMPQDPDWGLM